jgi:hypothetical protein
VFASTVRRSTIAVWFCSDGGHGKEAGSRIVDFENDNVVKPISFILSRVLFRWAATAQVRAEGEVDRALDQMGEIPCLSGRRQLRKEIRVLLGHKLGVMLSKSYACQLASRGQRNFQSEMLYTRYSC